MNRVTDIGALEALYGKINPNSLAKVATEITPEYAEWILASRFCVLSTVGPSGTDGSPRGDAGSVVRIQDKNTILMPDWRGNNRLDSLRNIVEDGRISLMFMVPGKKNVIRLNGTAYLDTDPELVGQFEQGGKSPTCVIVISIVEIYSQCARALVRSDIWGGADAPELPTMGDILRAQTNGDVDGQSYDKSWSERAKKTMW